MLTCLWPQERTWADRAGACGQLDLEMTGEVVSSYPSGPWLGCWSVFQESWIGGWVGEGTGRAGFRMMTLITKVFQAPEVALTVQWWWLIVYLLRMLPTRLLSFILVPPCCYSSRRPKGTLGLKGEWVVLATEDP